MENLLRLESKPQTSGSWWAAGSLVLQSRFHVECWCPRSP